MSNQLAIDPSGNVIRIRVPMHVNILLLAILGSGIAAAVKVSSTLWWTTAAMVALITYACRQKPENVDADADPSELPLRIQLLVSRTFANLPSGDARELLRGVVRPARTLYASAESNDSLSEGLLRDCAELVQVSCETAEELARAEQLLERDPQPWKAAEAGSVRQGLVSSRDLMRRRLSDAADALSQLYVQSVERGTVSSDRVAELAAELSAEVSVRKRVSADMKALLDN